MIQAYQELVIVLLTYRQKVSTSYPTSQCLLPPFTHHIRVGTWSPPTVVIMRAIFTTVWYFERESPHSCNFYYSILLKKLLHFIVNLLTVSNVYIQLYHRYVCIGKNSINRVQYYPHFRHSLGALECILWISRGGGRATVHKFGGKNCKVPNNHWINKISQTSPSLKLRTASSCWPFHFKM